MKSGAKNYVVHSRFNEHFRVLSSTAHHVPLELGEIQMAEPMFPWSFKLPEALSVHKKIRCTRAQSGKNFGSRVVETPMEYSP